MSGQSRGRGSPGCGTWLGILFLLGLTIKYWYVALAIVMVVVVIGLVARSQQRQRALHRPGPRDPWLDEVAVALADFELVEQARNTGAQLGGVPLEGDIGLQAKRFSIFLNVFATDELARQAELGLRANPQVRSALSAGHSAIRTAGRVVYVANGRGGVVDEFRLEEVVHVVSPISIPPPRQVIPAASFNPGAQQPGPGVAQLGASAPDALEQLRKLAELHAGGALTDDEFDAKKRELLRRI